MCACVHMCGYGCVHVCICAGMGVCDLFCKFVRGTSCQLFVYVWYVCVGVRMCTTCVQVDFLFLRTANCRLG